MRRRTAEFVLLLAGLLSFAACGTKTVYVPIAPPQRRVEVKPARPGPEYAWQPGRWVWRSGRHVWIAGHWTKAKGGRRWIPGHWRHTPRGWVWQSGRWAR
jgi:hypothetical protein